MSAENTGEHNISKGGCESGGGVSVQSSSPCCSSISNNLYSLKIKTNLIKKEICLDDGSAFLKHSVCVIVRTIFDANCQLFEGA